MLTLLFLKEDTAADIKLGPFVDCTDGKTYETGMAAAMDHATTGVRLSKNGGAFADRHEGTEPVYDAFGYYLVKLDTTDTNTPGTLTVIFGDAAVCLPCQASFQIIAANVYDSLFGAAGTDLLDVSVVQIGGVAQSATDLKDFADTGYDPATHKVQGVVLADTVTTYTGNTPQTGDSFARIGATGSGLTTLATAAALTVIDDFLDTEVAAILADTNELQTDWVNGGRLDLLIDGIKTKTDYLPSATAGNAGGVFIAGTNAATTVTTALTTTFTGNLTGSVASVTGAVGSVTGAVGSVTGAVGSVTGAVGSVAANGITATSIAADAINAAAVKADAVTKIQSGLATAAALTVIDDFLDTEVAAILADTNELQTDWVNGGRLDLLLDATATATAVADVPTVAEFEARTLVAANYATAAALTAVDDYVDAEVAAIQAVTAKLDTALELDGAVYRFTVNALELAPTGGSAPTVAQIRAEMDANSTQLAAIVADTNELQAEFVDGGRLDLLIDGIKTKTDYLPSVAAGGAGGVFIAGTNAATTITTALTTTFTGNLTGSVASVTGAVGSVTGAVGSVTGAVGSVTGAVGSVTGNVGGSVASVANIAPTGTGLTAIPWNAAWDAEVQSEVQDAITASSLPTAATMADAVWDEVVAGHVGAGSAGATLYAISNTQNTWNIAIPGEFVEGSAGAAFSTIITSVASILADTNELQAEFVDGGRTDLLIDGIKTKTDFLPSVAAGGAGGVFIAGTNAATTVTTALTTTFTGNLTGSVASVTGAVGSVTGAVGSVTGTVGSVTGAVGSVTGNVGGNVTGSVGTVAANGITATSIAADAINAAAVKADAVTKIQNGLATPTNITAGTITTVTNLTNAPTNGDLTATMKTSAQTAAAAALTAYDPPTNTEMEARTLVAANYATAAALTAVDDFLDTEVAAILADTNELQTDWANGGRLDLILDAASAPSAATVADAVWDEVIAGHIGAGSAGLALSGATAPSAATVADAVWDEASAGHVIIGTLGQLIDALVKGRYHYDKVTRVEQIMDAAGNVVATFTITDTVADLTKL